MSYLAMLNRAFIGGMGLGLILVIAYGLATA